METSQLSRGQFLKQLGLSSAALMSFYCLGTGLTSCSSSSEDPAPTTTTGGGTNTNSGVTGAITGAIDFTLDLTNANFSKLKTVGEFTYVGDIIIANAKGTFVALSKACTHQGTAVNYRSGTNDFFCPNHGSIFRTDGTVQKDPATRALTVYKTELLNSNNSLRVKA
ncbi:MAG: ubiquinol-cytochrome c reductase iron-sulfur subunit [Emticicia sp.]|uniref:QcrA and Rieske domain-containing protein n=1 Tax=Emticicia sp. TaxID=1930953 RepID=UPI003BA79986